MSMRDALLAGGRFQRQCELAKTLFAADWFNASLLEKGGVCSGTASFKDFLAFLAKHPEEAMVNTDGTEARFLSPAEKKARAEAAAKSPPQKVRLLRSQNQR